MKKRIKTKQVTRHMERSAAEKRKIQAVRGRFRDARPGLEQLVSAGDVEGRMAWGDFLRLREVFRALKRMREERGLSLADVAVATGIGKSALSRLESGIQKNPTISTIYRYARAVGAEIGVTIRPVVKG